VLNPLVTTSTLVFSPLIRNLLMK